MLRYGGVTTLLRSAALIGLGLPLLSCAAPTPLPSTTPFGYVDAPAQGAHVRPSFLARGWALDDDPHVQISAIVDGTTIVPISFRIDRPDVAKVFPNYGALAKHSGWKVEITVSTFGPHSLVVRYADTAGHTYDIGPIAIVIDRPEPPAIAGS
jgi:hypothetical protein